MSRAVTEVLHSLRFWLAVMAVVVLALKVALMPYPWPLWPPSECVDPPFDHCAFVFDEAHYVPAVRKMMMGMPANLEHPPLSKLLIMAGILLLGDNPYGWRSFSAACGAASVYLLGLIAYRLLGRRRLAYVAALVFALDVTSFNLSSIAILDPPALMFSLLFVYFALEGRITLASISMGLALLCKLTSLTILCAILLFLMLKSFHESGRAPLLALRRWFPTAERMALVSAAVLVVGLACFDYAYGVFNTPFEHLAFMLSYHSSLTFENVKGMSLPLSWVNPFNPNIPETYYFVGIERWTASGRVLKVGVIDYRGVQSPFWWMMWPALVVYPLVCFIDLRRGEFPEVEALFLCWILFSYFIYIPVAYLVRRIVYFFYFYSTVPILAIVTPYWLRGHRLILAIIIAVQFGWFCYWFPVKAGWLIDLLASIL